MWHNKYCRIAQTESVLTSCYSKLSLCPIVNSKILLGVLINFMRWFAIRMCFCIAACIVSQNPFLSDSMAWTKRHHVVYGGFSTEKIPSIVSEADILVIGQVTREQLRLMKRLKPDLVALKYCHAIGMNNGSEEWGEVKKNTSWFVHDSITGEKLKERHFGWYLMDPQNQHWRFYLASRISKNTESEFDGVFLDDFWGGFVNKFEREHTHEKAIPEDGMIRNWEQAMVELLAEIRRQYSGLVFINGAHEKYIEYVDGCMEESFVHSSWNPDRFSQSHGRYLRSIRKIESLKKYGKMILVQSGTKGDGSGDVERLSRYCWGSYLLVMGENTSFSFNPDKGYYFKGLRRESDFGTDLGEALSQYYVFREGDGNPNLLANGDFDDGLRHWEVKSGKPMPDNETMIEGKSILFRSDGKRKDSIAGEYLPVVGNKIYDMVAQCKADSNKPGSANYKKLGLQGRFYDKDKRQLPGAFDLQFSAGTYDWLPFDISHKSPENAAYFRVFLGFIGDGRGRGWVDNVYFGLKRKRERILRRDFSCGIVFVNSGDKDATVELMAGSGEHEIPRIVEVGAQDSSIFVIDHSK